MNPSFCDSSDPCHRCHQLAPSTAVHSMQGPYECELPKCISKANVDPWDQATRWFGRLTQKSLGSSLKLDPPPNSSTTNRVNILKPRMLTLSFGTMELELHSEPDQYSLASLTTSDKRPRYRDANEYYTSTAASSHPTSALEGKDALLTEAHGFQSRLARLLQHHRRPAHDANAGLRRREERGPCHRFVHEAHEASIEPSHQKIKDVLCTKY